MYLDSPRLADVARVLGAAVERLQAGGKVIMILDQPDLLLAAASPGDGVTGTAWKDVVLGLREVSSPLSHQDFPLRCGTAWGTEWARPMVRFSTVQ